MTATTSGGSIDLAASCEFLYSQNAVAGTVDEFHGNADSSLARIGTVTGLHQFDHVTGIEGIVAS